MANVRFRLNRKGVGELLKSPEAGAVCELYAKEAVTKLGDGYEVTTYTGRTRANASIRAVTPETIVDQKKHNTILKALR